MLADTFLTRDNQIEEVARRLKGRRFGQYFERRLCLPYNKIAVRAAKSVAFDMFGVCLRVERRNVQRGRVVQRCH